MKISKNARIGILNSSNRNRIKPEQDLNNFDIVFNQYFSMGKLLQEWVIVNPDAIEWFTANPHLLPNEVKSELERGAKPNDDGSHPWTTLDPSMRHASNNWVTPWYLRKSQERITAYLNADDAELPPMMRTVFINHTNKCSDLFSKVATP